jgi:hypothetical protein
VLVAGLMADAAVVAVAVATGHSHDAQFGEDGFVTPISAGLLVLAAALATATFAARRAAGVPIRTAAVWLLAAGGLVFLAIDEIGKVHEHADELMHEVLGVTPTPITDHLDDLIIGLYGLAAVVACLRWRAELLRDATAARHVGAALALLFVDVGLDALENPVAIIALAPTPASRVPLREWVRVAEEGLKIVAETVFVAGLFASWQAARAERSR